MKKMLTLFVALILVLFTSSCGRNNKDRINDDDKKQPSSKIDKANFTDQEESDDSASQDVFLTDESEDGIRITGYKGTASEINIPESIDGKPVVGITYLAFSGKNTIKKVTIPNSVKIIEARAFWKCESLESVSLGDGVETIGEGAFCDCPKIESIIFPASVREIYANAFANCSNLKTVEFVGSHDLSLEPYIFRKTAVENIRLPEGVTAIYFAAFAYMPLKSIYIPESVTSIEDGSFMYSADNLTITSKAGSVAEKYAKENKIPFVSE